MIRLTRRTALRMGIGAVVLPYAFPALAQEIKRGGTLVVGSAEIPRHLNGAVQSGNATAMPSTQLFASPLRFDDKWNPQPYLAESWKLAEDGKSLTLNVRKNAVFHDGKPVTSEDVAFSVMAIKANHPFITMFAPVERVDTPNPHTAIIRLNKSHPAIVLAMSPDLCPILPKHIYDGGDLKNNPRNSQNVVGSGPFKFVQHEPGRRIVMERFDKFFLEGKPYLDRVIMAYNPDSSGLILGLERGDIQMLPFVSNSTELRRLADDKNIELTPKGYEGNGPINWLAFNLEREPLSDIRVRKAIATAIDKKFIIKALMGGFAQVADGPIVSSSPFYAPNSIVHYPYDLKKAAGMLDAAGHKVGADGERFKLTIDYLPNIDGQQKMVAEYIRGQLKKVGITVEVRASADFASWARRRASHDFDMSMDIVANWGDPVIGVHRIYLSSNIRPIVWTNTQSYRNPEVDRLLEAAGSEMDLAKREADYAAFQKIVTDELPIYFINVVPYHTAASKKVGNLPTTIWGPMAPYDEVYLK